MYIYPLQHCFVRNRDRIYYTLTKYYKKCIDKNLKNDCVLSHQFVVNIALVLMQTCVKTWLTSFPWVGESEAAGWEWDSYFSIRTINARVPCNIVLSLLIMVSIFYLEYTLDNIIYHLCEAFILSGPVDNIFF